MPTMAFSWFDYTFFCGMLGLSVIIGIYFGFFDKQDTTEEYLLGGKSMKILPVAMSLVASHISGITILAVPADVYRFGSNYWWICISIPLVCLITSYIFLPVYFKLEFTSVYEYLNIRFDKKIRTLASFLFTLSVFFYNPVVVYIPALAFSQATGINVHLITPVVCVICIFYTTIGGLKAVVWTDALQFVGIIGSSIAVFFVGASAAGGFSVVWEKAVQGHRLDLFNLNFDPTIRDDFWAMVIGATFQWLFYIALNQGSVQKFLAVPTLQHARKAIIIYILGMITLKSLSVFTGDIMYAKYSNCDPLTSKQISRSDQLLPFFVIDVAGKIPGLPGLFIAGVFSAALSTLSATLNTVAGTIYKDFISPFMPANTTEKRASNILKLLVIISGTICTVLVFIVEKMGGMLPFVTALQGIAGGPLVGLFSLGVLFPQANSKGALYGGIIALIFVAWKEFGSQWYQSQGLIKGPIKPLSVENCVNYLNISVIQDDLALEEPFVLYRISFWYNTLIGAVIVIIIGLIISWFTNKNQPPVNPDLISPVMHFMLPKSSVSSTKDYLSVDH
ncbi:hypothetical protein ILUMI_04247, partial [Ignelater luminosus]